MGLYQRINKLHNVGKKALVGGLLGLGCLALGAKASAQETHDNSYNLNPPQIVETLERAPTPSLEEIVREKGEPQVKILPERRIILNFANPIDDSEANSNTWYSLEQAIGKGSDYVGIKLGLDNSALGRVGILVLQGYLSDAISISSHELAHIREGKRYGPYDYSFKLNSLDFAKNFVKQYGYAPTFEQHFKEIVGGLNQDEFNAYTLFRNSTLFGDRLKFDEGIAFLRTKFYDVAYNVLWSEELNINECASEFSKPEIGDINAYLCLLKSKGIDISKKRHLIETLLADTLSISSWDSAVAIFNYLRKGERITKTTIFEIGGVTINPPLISHYLTSNGSFYDITSIVNPNRENPIELNVGTSIPVKSKPIKTFRLNTSTGTVEEVTELYKPEHHLRLGFQYHNLRLGKSENAMRISPFAYLTMRHEPFRYEGVSAGTEVNVPISHRFELTGKAEYNRNDAIENTVKGKDEGFRFVLGLMGRF